MWIFGLFIPFTVWCIAYIAGILADLITTKIALTKYGLKESNPIMAKFKDPVLVSGLVSLATVIFAIVAHNVAEPKTASASIFCAIFAVYRFICAINNWFRIRKEIKKQKRS